MNQNEISAAAAAMGRKGGKANTPAQQEARAKSKGGGRPVNWEKAPPRGCRSPKSELYRFTVVRLSDNAERFTDRKPRLEIRQSSDFMVWDNRENEEVR